MLLGKREPVAGPMLDAVVTLPSVDEPMLELPRPEVDAIDWMEFAVVMAVEVTGLAVAAAAVLTAAAVARPDEVEKEPGDATNDDGNEKGEEEDEKFDSCSRKTCMASM